MSLVLYEKLKKIQKPQDNPNFPFTWLDDIKITSTYKEIIPIL